MGYNLCKHYKLIDDPDDAVILWFCSTYPPKATNLTMVYNDKFRVYTTNQAKLNQIDILPRPPTTEPNFSIDSVKDVEKAAKEIVIDSSITIEGLVKELKNQCRNSLQDIPVPNTDVIRIFYYWLTSQNVAHVNYGVSINPLSVCYQLNLLKKKDTTYAIVFALMCHYADIPCVIVKGKVKGVKYHPGKELNQNHDREWNAVLVSGDWRFVDCFWGIAKCPYSTEETLTDPWYLFPDPEQLIFSHFPDEPVWQLIKSPVPMSVFKDKAFLWRRFFEMKMNLLTDDQSQIVCDQGEIELQFLLNQDVAEHQKFVCIVKKVTTNNSYELVNIPDESVKLDFIHKQFSDDTMTDEVNEQATERKSSVVEGLTLSVKVRFPERGNYLIEIVGRDSDNDNCHWIDDYDWVAKYFVCCRRVPDWLVLFPIEPEIGYGPNSYLTKCGLKAISHKGEGIKCYEGNTINLKFQVRKDAPTRNVSLMFKLKKRCKPGTNETGFDDEESGATDEAIFKPLSQTSTINIPVCIPEEGDYQLSCNAILNSTDKGHVIHYLVFCQKDSAEKMKKLIEEAIQKLTKAIEVEELNDLKKALRFTESKNLHRRTEVKTLYDQAKALRRQIEYSKSIPQFNGISISKLNRYLNADPLVENLFRTGFILLGYSPHQLRDWNEIRGKITNRGNNNLNRKLEEFSNDAVTEDKIRAIQAFQGEGFRRFNLYTISNVYRDAGSFAIWVNLVLDIYYQKRESA